MLRKIFEIDLEPLLEGFFLLKGEQILFFKWYFKCYFSTCTTHVSFSFKSLTKMFSPTLLYRTGVHLTFVEQIFVIRMYKVLPILHVAASLMLILSKYPYNKTELFKKCYPKLFFFYCLFVLFLFLSCWHPPKMIEKVYWTCIIFSKLTRRTFFFYIFYIFRGLLILYWKRDPFFTWI